MARARLLLVVPALLIAGAVAVTLMRNYRPPDEHSGGPATALDTATVGGVKFEIEHRPGSEKYEAAWAADRGAVVRGEDRFEYHHGIPLVNGTAFPSPAAGDTVRWNLEGPLLVNGQPVAPHRFQPRPLDAPPTELVWPIRHPSDAPRDSLSADWSKAGRVLVTAHGDGVVRVWDPDRGVVRTEITPEAPTTGRKRWGFKAAVSPDGKTVAAANVQAPAVTLWEADTGKLLATLIEPAGNVTDLRFRTDRVLLEARGGTLYSRVLIGDRAKVTKWGSVHIQVSAAIAISNEWVALNDGQHVYEPIELTSDGSTTFVQDELATGADTFALSPAKSIFATVSDKGSLILHGVRSGQLTRELWWRRRPDGVTPTIGALAFFPDGNTLAVGAADGLHLYDVDSGRERGWVQTLSIRSLAVSGDGATLAATCEHGPAVLLWRTADLAAR